MPEDGLREEVTFDDVVVQVVQTGPVGVERSEAGCRVELRAQVGEVRHPQIGGGLRVGGADLDREVQERAEDDGQNLRVLRPQFGLGAPDAGPFQPQGQEPFGEVGPDDADVDAGQEQGAAVARRGTRPRR